MTVRIFLLPTRQRYRECHGKHLLLLAWAFPPEVTGGVYRPISLVRGAKELGWKVTVISGFDPVSTTAAGVYLAESMSDGVTIIRLKSTSLEPSYKLFFPRINGGFLNLLNTIELVRSKLSSDPPTIVMASGPPFHNFVAAREIANSFSVPYVIDYRDEWTECPFDFVECGNLDRFFEKKCGRDASSVFFTTESQLDHYRRVFGVSDEAKFRVVPNGWTAEDLPTYGVENPLCQIDMRLAFVGFLSEHTLPHEFLVALEGCLESSKDLATSLRVAFVGSKSDGAVRQLQEFKYSNVIEDLGLVSKPVALRIMQDAFGLILINEPRLERYIPGKLYDYISMRTPILVFGGGGEVCKLVKTLRVGVVVENSSHEELKTALVELRTLKPNLHSKEVDMWLTEHSRTVQARKMMDVLASISKGKQC